MRLLIDDKEIVPIGSITPGTVVDVGGIQMEILDTHYPTSDGGEGVFCLARDILFYKVFDKNDSNNWKTSPLRKYMNKDFKDELIEKSVEEALLPFERDLTSDDGLKVYGKCVDTISLISCDEYRKYRRHISDKRIDSATNVWWTLTASSIPRFHPENVRGVRSVNDECSLSGCRPSYEYGGVVPVLCLNPSLWIKC